jgi:ribonuclease BN (tRNA processing enzyme)
VRVDEDGASIGYSADTGPGWAIKGLGEGIDVMVCEATLPDHLAGTAPHMSGGEAGRSARDAGVDRLVVTHVWPTFDPEDHRAEAAAAFGRDVGLAAPRARFDT